METGKGGSPARRCALTLAVAGAALMAVAAPAGAASKTVRPAAPRLGSHVAFGCANPANHGRSSGVLGAARVSVGGAVRCFSQALAHGRNEGPQVMAGPTGLGPSQIQSAYKLAGRPRAARRWRSSTPTTTRTPSPTWRRTAPRTACRRARPPTAASSKVNQNGADLAAAATDYGWATGDQPRPRHGVGGLPGLPHPARRGQLGEQRRPVQGRGHRRRGRRRRRDLEQLRRLARRARRSRPTTRTSTTPASRSPRAPATAATASSCPAASQYVTAVGGTTLTKASNARGWTETAWRGAGSGCSAYEPKPAWQTDTGCAKRTVADVSAVADPNTGVAVYDTVQQLRHELVLRLPDRGWDRAGARRLGAGRRDEPQLAADRRRVRARAVTPRRSRRGAIPTPHELAVRRHQRPNGTCSPSYLCTAGPGYDGPTGLGTPNGTTGF